ncbi:MAG: helix-turn-helix domain-containing protein [Dehalococcoidia bacterium]|nr:helix-turn-helix domain-containing protein [Dehalococcoidia bacterium]
MTLDQAAELMGVTSRHTRRILADDRERGAAALAHGDRGRRPVNATPEALTAEVVQVARSRGVRPIHPSPYLSLIQLPPFPQPSLLPHTQQQPPLPSRDPFRLS